MLSAYAMPGDNSSSLKSRVNEMKQEQKAVQADSHIRQWGIRSGDVSLILFTQSKAEPRAKYAHIRLILTVVETFAPWLYNMSLR